MKNIKMYTILTMIVVIVGGSFAVGIKGEGLSRGFSKEFFIFNIICWICYGLGRISKKDWAILFLFLSQNLLVITSKLFYFSSSCFG